MYIGELSRKKICAPTANILDAKKLIRTESSCWRFFRDKWGYCRKSNERRNSLWLLIWFWLRDVFIQDSSMNRSAGCHLHHHQRWSTWEIDRSIETIPSLNQWSHANENNQWECKLKWLNLWWLDIIIDKDTYLMLDFVFLEQYLLFRYPMVKIGKVEAILL